jgi:hypothetical protein
MYEFTHKGAWFRWDSLDARDKRLAGLSLAAALPAGFAIGLMSGSYAYRIGYWLASGGRAAPPAHFEEMLAEIAPMSAILPVVMLVALGFALVSAFAWWRFSRRQDEMFNRIQNHALGCGSAWTIAAATTWWFIEQAGLLPPLPLGAWLALAYLLVCLFWFRAVRRWG